MTTFEGVIEWIKLNELKSFRVCVSGRRDYVFRSLENEEIEQSIERLKKMFKVTEGQYDVIENIKNNPLKMSFTKELCKGNQKVTIKESDAIRDAILKNRDEYMRLLSEEHDALKEELGKRTDAFQTLAEKLEPYMPLVLDSLAKNFFANKPKENEKTTEENLNENDNN